MGMDCPYANILISTLLFIIHSESHLLLVNCSILELLIEHAEDHFNSPNVKPKFMFVFSIDFLQNVRGWFQ